MADTNILNYKKFSELQCTKVLKTTSKAFLTKWSQLGEDQSYVSLAILVVKGIFTHWKQALPNDTVSHIKHAWYDPHELMHHQRIDQVGKSFLINKITKASTRPQTTGSMLRGGKRRLQPSKSVAKKDKGIDGVIQNRKKFLLRGN